MLLWIILQRMVNLKALNLYYHIRVLISIAKTFQFIIFNAIEIYLFNSISFLLYFWNWIEIYNDTPLMNFSRNGQSEIVQLLLSHPKIDVNCKDIWILESFIIFQFQCFDAISMWNHLWNWIANHNHTPLVLASSRGHTQVVQLLLSHPKIDVNCKDIWIRNLWYNWDLFI